MQYYGEYMKKIVSIIIIITIFYTGIWSNSPYIYKNSSVLHARTATNHVEQRFLKAMNREVDMIWGKTITIHTVLRIFPITVYCGLLILIILWSLITEPEPAGESITFQEFIKGYIFTYPGMCELGALICTLIIPVGGYINFVSNSSMKLGVSKTKILKATKGKSTIMFIKSFLVSGVQVLSIYIAYAILSSMHF